ncbi:hypothetical protein FRC17_009401 [Serendipita sp. 399]|nr:hypothetical protein FRC17_009401 [Serendipita sp. 399]
MQATFLAAVQAQVMSITISTPLEEQTTATCFINAFFLMGLVLDIMSAFLAFLTFRWFQRLSNEEKQYLEDSFDSRRTMTTPSEGDDEEAQRQSQQRKGGKVKGTDKGMKPLRMGERIEAVIVSWSSFSLFIPWTLLTTGISFMALGIQIFVWTRQKLMVSILVTITYLVVIIFMIGREQKRRKRIIRKLTKRQGDW